MEYSEALNSRTDNVTAKNKRQIIRASLKTGGNSGSSLG